MITYYVAVLYTGERYETNFFVFHTSAILQVLAVQPAVQEVATVAPWFGAVYLVLLLFRICLCQLGLCSN
jgi:hypothetical protein